MLTLSNASFNLKPSRYLFALAILLHTLAVYVVIEANNTWLIWLALSYIGINLYLFIIRDWLMQSKKAISQLNYADSHWKLSSVHNNSNSFDQCYQLFACRWFKLLQFKETHDKSKQKKVLIFNDQINPAQWHQLSLLLRLN